MKILLNGYSGKMGSVVYAYLKDKYEFVALCDIRNLVKEEDVINSDIIIDFSSIECAKRAFDLAVKHQKNIIIGTTGFNEDDVQYFAKQSKEAKISMFLIPNFLKSIQELKKFLNNLDIKELYLNEKHHKSKKDRPSGTAKYLLKKIPEELVFVNSARTDFYCYEHKIEIINEFETIEIVHRCYNKIGYAKGVEIALLKLGSFIGLRQEL